MNRYIFLTGATGLLGAYLLRDLLLAGRHCAVVVRASRFESAEQRIESLLARFETEGHLVLPRPVVLEGDLSQPMFGLGESEQHWVREHCDTMLHNAASLSFLVDEKTNEPYRSNVNGTENVLEFCRQTGIRQFHHVSTAYVCGLRTDCCRETELDVGQIFGNDYEKSKVQAEKLVRSANFLDSLTVYRPAIIVGDSQTGYTSTFHGFYTPLKIVHSFVKAEINDGTPLMAILGLSGSERKHFVPVDWTAQAAVRILTNPQHHGKTYHLTPSRPVTCKTTLRVFEDALRRYVKSKPSAPKTPDINEVTIAMLGDVFREQMEVYKAYWRDDPQFDRTNIETALPDFPCPNVSYAVLIRLALFALNTGFGWPRQQSVKPKYWVRDDLQNGGGIDSSPFQTFGLQVNGQGGGAWTAQRNASKEVHYSPGLPGGNEPLIYMNSETFHRLVRRELPLEKALQLGAVHIENPPQSGIGFSTINLWKQ